MTTPNPAPPAPYAPRTDLWSIPERGNPRLFTLVGRALRFRCPYCGDAKIVRRWFQMPDECPNCATRFAREDGYFLGAYAINLVIAEFLGLGAVLVVLFQMDLSLLMTEAIAIATAVGLPVLFFPYSRMFWMALDLFFDHELTRTVVRASDLERHR